MMWMMLFQLVHFCTAVVSLLGSTVTSILYNSTGKEHVATSFDEIYRLVLVTTYLFALCLLYAVRFRDDYDSAESDMFVGLGSLDLTHFGGSSGSDAVYMLVVVSCSAIIAVVTAYGLTWLTHLLFMRMAVAPRVEGKLIALARRRSERTSKYRQRADAYHQKRTSRVAHLERGAKQVLEASSTSVALSSTGDAPAVTAPQPAAPLAPPLPYDAAGANDRAVQGRRQPEPPVTVTDVES